MTFQLSIPLRRLSDGFQKLVLNCSKAFSGSAQVYARMSTAVATPAVCFLIQSAYDGQRLGVLGLYILSYQFKYRINIPLFCSLFWSRNGGLWISVGFMKSGLLECDSVRRHTIPSHSTYCATLATIVVFLSLNQPHTRKPPLENPLRSTVMSFRTEHS